MNKQNDYSHIASTWKGTQIEASIYSSEIPTTSTDTCNNSNTIANTLQEDSISSSQSPNIPPIQMICLPINKLDNNKTRKFIKSKKGYKSLVNHKIRLNSQQIKKYMKKERKNIDHKPTPYEDTSSKTNLFLVL